MGEIGQEIRDMMERVYERINPLEMKYEVSFLRMPVLRAQAVWLRGDERSDDFLIPLKPVFHGFEAGKMYPYEEFQAKIMEVLPKIRAHHQNQSHDDMAG